MLLKTLSIKYPFSELIVSGIKDVENRTTNYTYRGLLLVHTSLIPDDLWHEKCCIESYQIGLKHLNRLSLASKGLYEPIYGAIIGAVLVTDVYTNYNSPWTVYNNYQLLLNSPIKFEKPVYCKGKLGFWLPDKETINNISENDMKLIESLYQYSKTELGIEYILT